jgi:integrase
LKLISVIGLRDRALIGAMVYTFARVNAVLQMKVKDYFVQGRRGWVRLHEKGGKEHEVPCHHNLEQYLDEYIAAAGMPPSPAGSRTSLHNARATENHPVNSRPYGKQSLKHDYTLTCGRSDPRRCSRENWACGFTRVRQPTFPSPLPSRL